ncbi:ferredoxin family protein [Burkholderia multivorans]|uniref:4Fe-4S dicluster domain-containing protein n=1 Tax=Burkholderia multivorans TaxID=87883 RepID=UPI001C2187C3|nr:ferredoxin family protein [Burkholderia multivorans]
MASSESPLSTRGQRRRSQGAEKVAIPPRSKAAPGVFKPVVDARRCEGKGDCVAVCPYDVFVVGRLPDVEFASMPLLVRLKLWAHGRKTAFTPNADACRACGACVTACPEHAITLARSDHRSIVE